MLHDRQKPPPPGWGHDLLSYFIETAFENAKASYANGLTDRFFEAEEFYRVCADDSWKPNRRTPVSLIVKSWSSYNASILLAMSGFCSETYTMSRNTIECGAYSAVMFLNQDLVPSLGKQDELGDRQKCVQIEVRVSQDCRLH